MLQIPENVEVSGLPPYIAFWSITRVDRFIPAILGRWHREHSGLRSGFFLLLCPRVEVNALGGLPGDVLDLTDPRQRLTHFTGCQRPYMALMLAGEDADQRRARIHELLPWSESYWVEIDEASIRLSFIDATEELVDQPGERMQSPRRFHDLCSSGEITGLLG